MKNMITTCIAILAMTFTFTAFASHSVRGYTRHDGTYVAPHMSMDPGEARSSGYSYHNNVMVPNGY